MQTLCTASRVILCLSAMLAGCAGSPDAAAGRGGRGVQLRRDAEVFCGSAFNCTRPAVFDYDKVKVGTAEWKTIVRDGVQPGSARYKMLNDQMYSRMRETIRRAAQERGHDLVVRTGDIRDAQGLEVPDITNALLGG